ncbi:hypothetical protein [Bradyrhizobium valentinum]|uniref:Uncharacterized protein n=1 Tax=Bradyrhizobium valentinum TaxID=1518501 RepID=A0A0R3M9P6_9BRAD|nr:hypothetical protein [Bradyrhizobium valentinum]KRR14541.1 hypothetical protein CP49_25860 [Bradyrhizobium valentinum]
MTPHDQQRLADVVTSFIEGCGLYPPLYVIAIGSNGAVSVSLHTRREVKQVCGHQPGRMDAPITVTVVQAEDGRGSSARIEFVTTKPTMQ